MRGMALLLYAGALVFSSVPLSLYMAFSKLGSEIHIQTTSRCLMSIP